ncbi:hypothetical protein N7523_010280 [Penicillium sp. IBT 18751x]|nr:hypothetical protein N7523_010265 [Penicillium sp. IBT 18751x]KAJ6105206.1 hypothetical protein N7523_010280 [Penicillium sp. IBT 18751x]
MAQTSRKRRRPAEDSDSDTANLLGQSFKMRPAAKKRRAATPPPGRGRATAGNINIGPSRQSRITLRLGPRRHRDAEQAAKAWWAASELLEQERVEGEQDKAVAKEELRQDWIRRLRPTPARRARSLMEQGQGRA